MYVCTLKGVHRVTCTVCELMKDYSPWQFIQARPYVLLFRWNGGLSVAGGGGGVTVGRGLVKCTLLAVTRAGPRLGHGWANRDESMQRRLIRLLPALAHWIGGPPRAQIWSVVEQIEREKLTVLPYGSWSRYGRSGSRSWRFPRPHGVASARKSTYAHTHTHIRVHTLTWEFKIAECPRPRIQIDMLRLNLSVKLGSAAPLWSIYLACVRSQVASSLHLLIDISGLCALSGRASSLHLLIDISGLCALSGSFISPSIDRYIWSVCALR